MINHESNPKRKPSAFTLIVSFIAIALLGIALIPLLPVKLNPSYSLPGFTVRFTLPGTSARVIEMEATCKLEAMLARISGIKSIHSTSGNGWGAIAIELDKHAGVDNVRFEASTIIRQTWPELPEGTSYPYLEMTRPKNSTSGPFVSFTLNAPSTPMLIQQYAEDHIKTKLAQLPGVYRVNVSGATPMEWRLEYNNEQLNHLNLHVDDISQAIKQHYQKEFLGTCDREVSSGKREWIRLALVPQESTETFDPTQIWLKTSDGKMIRLNELVTASRMEEAPQSYYRINGLNSIYISVTAEETANQLKLSQQVNKVVGELKQSLPAGYKIHTRFDSTEYIREEINKIYLRTGLTLLILLVFLWFITRSLRYLFLVVTSLTINMAIAILFYYLLGLEMQLYSLAGITVSLNLILDNTIVMTDHLLNRRNMKAFIPIMAATLTTVGALSIIFFLDESIQLNLQDFAIVVMVNLIISLFVALFFLPSIIEKIGLRKRRKKKICIEVRSVGRIKRQRLSRRFPIYFTCFYAGLIRALCRWRVAMCLLLLLAFGLPVFLLPEKIDESGCLTNVYNQTIGSNTYSKKIKPIVNVALGGTLRLFVQKVYEGSYFTSKEDVVLYINATLPNGSTLEQMNVLIQKMESYLSRFPEISQFQTTISSAQRSHIAVYFKKKYKNGAFPYLLESNVVSQALQLGGGSWSVYGLQDQGFNNDIRAVAGSFQVKLYGYNYDELYGRAEQLREKLLSHRRIKEVTLNSEFSRWKDDYQEFYFNLDKQRMAQEDIPALSLFESIRPIFGKNMDAGKLITENGVERIKLTSKQSTDYDIWAMKHMPHTINKRTYKLSDLATIEKGLMPQQIAKENQQYRLCLQYEYIGPNKQGQRVLKQDLEEFNQTLPMGYSAEEQNDFWRWGKDEAKQYRILLIVVAIIFFITAILFNSLKQPLAIIFTIPISYIGVFLAFYWFKLNFDQGGFAAFVLLCGITVNAGIYILNEYNSIRRHRHKLSPIRAYTKAWNRKIIPILLTIITTILGFIPFLIGETKETFWFPLAAGTIGGLLMSIVGLFLFLPIFTLKQKS